MWVAPGAPQMLQWEVTIIITTTTIINDKQHCRPPKELIGQGTDME